MAIIDVSLTVSSEEREDRWVVHVHELDYYAYGKTEDEALERVPYLFNALAESFGKDLDGFRDYLTTHQVKFIWAEDSPENESVQAIAERGFARAAIQPQLQTFNGIEVGNALAV